MVWAKHCMTVGVLRPSGSDLHSYGALKDHINRILQSIVSGIPPPYLYWALQPECEILMFVYHVYTIYIDKHPHTIYHMSHTLEHTPYTM